MPAPDAGRAHGVGTVTKWTPDDLRVYEEIVRHLIETRGLEGAALHAEALRLAALEGHKPYETARSENTLVNGGTNIMLLALCSNPVPTYYTNANAALGVGDSSTAFALSQTNLQGAVNVTDRIRKPMNVTFPSVAANVLTAQATFGTGDANFHWQEWGFFNNVADGSGTMLNRAVADNGTKTSAAAWQLTFTLTQN